MKDKKVLTGNKETKLLSRLQTRDMTWSFCLNLFVVISWSLESYDENKSYLNKLTATSTCNIYKPYKALTESHIYLICSEFWTDLLL